MLSREQAEHVVRRIARLDRQQVIAGLRRCPAKFPIDFTADWLDSQPLAELRHVYAAICIQCGHQPDAPSDDAPIRAA